MCKKFINGYASALSNETGCVFIVENIPYSCKW